MPRLLLPTLVALIASPSAHALEAACKPYLNAAEQSAAAPARHSVVQIDAKTRIETIKINGKSYMNMGSGWMKAPAAAITGEQQMLAEMRSGKTKLWDCKKLGRETVDGISTTVYSYQIEMHGLPAPKDAPKVFIGDDGLIYAGMASGAKQRFRYTGVSAPKVSQ